MNDDKKNNGTPGDLNDEIFERIAAEKRRKLNQLISSFEDRERSKGLNEDTKQTIHRDLFPGERKKPEHPKPRGFSDNEPPDIQIPLDAQLAQPQTGRFSENEDIKLRTPQEPRRPRPGYKPAPIVETESEVVHEDEVRIYSPTAKAAVQFVQMIHQATPEITVEPNVPAQPRVETKADAPVPQPQTQKEPQVPNEPKVQYEPPVSNEPPVARETFVARQKPEPIAQPENTQPENAQETLLKSRRERMENFVLDTTGPQSDDTGEDFEFTRQSKPDEIALDLFRWTRKKLMRGLVCLVIFIASLFIVLSPALPATALPYDLATPAPSSVNAEYTAPDDGIFTVDEVNESTVVVSGQKYEVNPNKQQVRVIIGVLLGLNILVLLVSIDTLWGGLLDLLRRSPTADSAASVIWIFTTLQGILLMSTAAPETFAAGVFGVFLPFAAFGVMIAHLTGFLRQIRERNGFEVISKPGPSYHLRLQNEANSNILQRPADDEDAVAGVFVKADFAADYFSMSDSEDGADRMNKILVPAAVLFGLLLALAVSVLKGGGFGMFVTVWTATVCMLTPLASGINCMLPQVRASAVNKKHEIAISNQCAFDDAFDMTSMLFCDTEIFNPKTMVLNGIKTFSGKRMDEAIILAASAVEKRGGPLKELFTSILSENEGYLLEVDSETVYQPEKGMVCWISGKRVILGAREFISGYDIILPSDDFDKKFTKRNRSLLYLAFGGELIAVLLVTYKIESETAHALRALAKKRVRLLVDTRDPCIKSSVISKQLGLPDDYVVIIDAQAKAVVEKITRERTALKAGAVCGGEMKDRIRTVLACFKLRKSLSVGFAIQTGLMVLALGALLVAAFSTTLSAMTVLLVLAAQGIVLGLSALVVCLPRYRNLW